MGKAFPYPASAVVRCFARSLPVWSRRYGASRAWKTCQRFQLRCSGSCNPPMHVTAFRVLCLRFDGFSFIAQPGPCSLWNRALLFVEQVAKHTNQRTHTQAL